MIFAGSAKKQVESVQITPRPMGLCFGMTNPSHFLEEYVNINKKQCSRQLQCKVPCGISDVMNSFLFINSSLSSLSSTSHAVCGEV